MRSLTARKSPNKSEGQPFPPSLRSVREERERARAALGMAFRPRRIVLGVTGSIAAYKAPEIIRGFVKAGFETRCILTSRAKDFVAPLTLATLSHYPPIENENDSQLWEMAHLSLAEWAPVLLIAPATADFIAKLAAGLGDNALSLLSLAFKGQVIVCPAMDGGMWEHPATKRNVETLRHFGYEIWGPELGELASGKIGIGRMVEPQAIIERVKSFWPSEKERIRKSRR